jgi:hypothetical protein
VDAESARSRRWAEWTSALRRAPPLIGQTVVMGAESATARPTGARGMRRAAVVGPKMQRWTRRIADSAIQNHEAGPCQIHSRDNATVLGSHLRQLLNHVSFAIQRGLNMSLLASIAGKTYKLEGWWLGSVTD